MTLPCLSFYHGTRSTDISATLHSFAGGAKPTGRGQGGQKSGFYVFNTPQLARHHAVKFMEQPGEPVMVCVECDFDSKKWDIDYEANAPHVMELIGQHASLLYSIVGDQLPYMDDTGAEQTFLVKRVFEGGVLVCPYPGRTATRCYRYDSPKESSEGMVRDANILQGITDRLCALSPEFAAAKVELLQRLATESGHAIKYIGAEPLPVKSIERFNGTEWKPLTMLPAGAAVTLTHAAMTKS